VARTKALTTSTPLMVGYLVVTSSATLVAQMAVKVRNRPLPIHGRWRPQAGRSLSAVYLAASRPKTRLPKTEWSSTRVDHVRADPAGAAVTVWGAVSSLS
jgi:hypothetical protein